MKHVVIFLIAVVLLSLTAIPDVQADNLQFTVNTGAQTRTWSGPNYTGAKFQRFKDYLWEKFPQLNPDGSPKPRNPSNEAAAFDDFAAALHEMVKQNVLAHERAKAAQAAQGGVPDFDPDG